MSAEEPGEESDQLADDHQDGEPAAESGAAAPDVAAWPEIDVEALKGKYFMKAGGVPGGKVAVTVSEGDVGKNGTPSGLFSRLTDQVGRTLHEVGNMFAPPLVLGAAPTNSMTIVFGDPFLERDPRQTELPYTATVNSAMRVATLIGLKDDELYNQALSLGRGAVSYVELARLVHTEGITLDWQVGKERPRLTASHAGLQVRRLTEPPPPRVRIMDIDGLLYRAIWESKGQGRVGIRLSKQSPRPPRRHGGTVVVRYDNLMIEEKVLHRLLGKPVIAQIEVIEYPRMANVLGEPPPHALIRDIEEGKRFDLLELLDEDEEVDDND